MRLKEKVLVSLALIFLFLGILLIISVGSFGKTQIIACDVGQGDAILIVTASGSQILVDGGPGRKVLECLRSKMPFWDRRVEMMVLTHPQKDHMEGLISVLANYKVETVVWTGAKAESELSGEWIKGVASEGANVIKPHVDQRLAIDEISFDVLWPTKEKVNEWRSVSPKDLNETSIVLKGNLDSERNICIYLTGDIPIEILEGLVVSRCQLLKVAHHGSKTGTSSLILEKVHPGIALISAGKNNQYGHPHNQVLDQLNSKGIQIYRTDTDGMVEINLERGELKVRQAN